MSSIVYVTDAGRAALESGTVISTQFKLGDGYGYDPSELDTDIRGSVVFSGVPLNPVIVSSQIYRYTVLLPFTLNVTFGEVALFLQTGDLFALAVFPQTITASPNPLDSDGISGNIDLFVRSDGTAFVDLNSGTAFAEASSINVLPPPDSTDAKFYVVPDPSAPHLPLLAYRKDVLWSYEGYTLIHDGVTITGALNSVHFIGMPSIPARAIVEFKTGSLTGISRVVSTLTVSEGNTTVYFDAPLTTAPAEGDQFMLFAAPEVSVTLGGILADGSVPFTGDQSLGDHRLTHVGDAVVDDDAANKAYVDNAIASAPINITGDLDLDVNRIINLDDPVNAGDAVNLGYAENNFLKLDGTNAPTDALNIGNSRLTNVGTPSADTDAVTKEYVDDIFLRHDGTVELSGDLSAGNHRITNLATPSSASDAISKGYVDGLIVGMAPREPVRVVADANVSLSTPGATLDTVALSNGDRILLTNQTTPTENGVWVWSSAVAPLVRAADMNTGTITPGAFLWAVEGSVYADSLWVLITQAPMTIGATELSFYRFGSNFANGLIRADGTVPFFGHQSMAGYRLTNLGPPVSNDDAATKSYVNQFALHVDGGNTPTTTMNWGAQRLSNLGSPVAPGDAVNRAYVDGLFDAAWSLDGTNLPTADQSLNNNKITDLAEPTGSADAATKGYADGTRVPRVYTNATATGSIEIDWTLYEVVDITMVGDVSLTLSNSVDGKAIQFRIKQDGTGNHTLAFNDTLRYSDEYPSLLLSTTANASNQFVIVYNDDTSSYQVVSTVVNSAATPGYVWNGTSRIYTVVSSDGAGTSTPVSMPRGPKLWKSVLTGSGVTLDADVEVSSNGSTWYVLATFESTETGTEYFSSIEDWAYYRTVIRTVEGAGVNWALTASTGD